MSFFGAFEVIAAVESPFSVPVSHPYLTASQYTAMSTSVFWNDIRASFTPFCKEEE